MALNDTEQSPFSAVNINGTTVRLEMAWYDSELEGILSGDGSRITGRWRKTVPGGDAVLPWVAERGSSARFLPLSEARVTEGNDHGLTDVTGVWRLVFSDDSGEDVVRGELNQSGSRVTGTMLTSVGDYRYLDGTYEAGLLRLSTFDGAHAFLFQARAAEGGQLVGDFWSRDSYHATWVGELVDDGEKILRDPWQEVVATRADGRFRFKFADVNGTVFSNKDERFQGKVVLVNLFGSWCPNCNDEAPLLAQMHRRWSNEGLEVVGLAFEFGGDSVRSRRVLAHYSDRHNVSYPLLLAGSSDKSEAAEAVPDISAVISYPTTVFIDRRGTIRWIHSGFAGPGTGVHHADLVAAFERRIQTLLSE